MKVLFEREYKYHGETESGLHSFIDTFGNTLNCIRCKFIRLDGTVWFAEDKFIPLHPWCSERAAMAKRVTAMR